MTGPPIRVLARAVPLVAAAALAFAGCRPTPLTDGVDDSTFVATMAELQRLRGERSVDSAARGAARDAVLRRRGLTAQRLERAADALARDPARALSLWREIDRRSEARRPATLAPGGVAPSPPARGRMPQR